VCAKNIGTVGTRAKLKLLNNFSNPIQLLIKNRVLHFVFKLSYTAEELNFVKGAWHLKA